MNQYKVKYYTSGGYKTSGSLETELTIKRDPSNQLCLYNEDTLIGDIEKIEALFLEQLGYQESITVFEVELVST
jgi:hypothetical protein